MPIVSEDETRYLIPRVLVHVPRHTSIVKHEPSYVVPIIKAKYTPTLKDPMFGVEVLKNPADMTADRLFHTVPKGNALEFEAARLRAEYGDNPRTHVSWFDTVYPMTEMFAAAFRTSLRQGGRELAPVAKPEAEQRAALPGNPVVIEDEIVLDPADDTDQIMPTGLDPLAAGAEG